VYRTDKRLMPAATAFVEFMNKEGSRLIWERIGQFDSGVSKATPKEPRTRPA